MRWRRIAAIATLVILVIGIGLAYRFLAPQGPPGPAESVVYNGQTWTVFRPELYDVAVEGTTIRLTLLTAARWAGNGQAGLVYRDVTGNFKATASVQTRKASAPSEPVSSLVSLGGLSARNPQGADVGSTENYVHIVAGNTPSGIGVETKTTVNGATSYEAVPSASGDSDLRICRIGTIFRLYKRPVGSDVWILAATYDRPDLPPTLQVGGNIYSVLLPDLQVVFDGLQIAGVEELAACEQD
ncbi:MAG: hypothetical protein H7Z42_09240 [Roseiflexaceae bacterium]|nr:hypothetical protein [Roseiflexaceae bacterium]